MTLSIIPDSEHPLPDSYEDQVASSFAENARVAASTATLMSELGLPFEMSEEDEKKAQQLFRTVDSTKKSQNNPPDLYNGAVAVRLQALLTEYDKAIVADAAQARTYIMNKLLDISDCGDTKHELRALELLGKMSDIGAFTEKSEITVTHKTSDDLRKAIEDKLKRLLLTNTSDAEDAKPSAEEELGLIEVEAKEVKDADQPG
jgi:glutathione synthase/RimK-type ligase-like ATP-grasp enzyme